MLVISRRIGESFVIGDEIEATIVDITGNKVVLGISAPASISIARLEASPRKPETKNRQPVKGDVR